jgi:alkylation response protein AidB-like acyl-CoA dehydrogenase
MTVPATLTSGISWLFGPAHAILTPETLTEEHRLVSQTAEEYLLKEVVPATARLEEKDWAVARALLKRSGDLGLLGVTVPEVYGGPGLDRVSSLLVSEQIGKSPSFGAAYGAQANLCVFPILAFGTDQQKSRYLPPLIAGDMVGAYALSESSSGSDALGARATASRQADGTFALSGEKLWITNGGFADLFVVFAKIEGTQFTAFLVERGFGGVTSGKEEHKMGLHGSSTTPVLFQNVPVPAANVLGDVGNGHKVAFGVLNFGRFQLGAMCSGGCKQAVGEAARYAAARRQFDRPISSFGAVRQKLGEMTARTYALEAVAYRIAGLLDARCAADESKGTDALRAALDELAIEASIAKVFGTETLDFVLDENVQIHGGNGYVRDYPAERRYRDARVNRIFEGTNEINRLLISGLILKRAAKGQSPLIQRAEMLRETLMLPPRPQELPDNHPLADETERLERFRDVAVMVAGLMLEKHGAAIQEEQELLSWLADIATDTFASDSAVARARSAGDRHLQNAALHVDAARVFVTGAAFRIEVAAREALAALAEGDALRLYLAALRRLLKGIAPNTVLPRRVLADATTTLGRYIFE